MLDTPADATRLTASEAVARMRDGTLTAEAYLGAFVERITARDAVVHAWSSLAIDAAMSAARERDAAAPKGLLHGVPVAIKDVVDTVELPTAYGSEAFSGHHADADAACVAALEAAGAIIVGKTVTAEFATYRPGPTANPHDPTHTPGGSSSGSAAAVADRQAPIAIGTQTAGSVIRPASFCGIYGFKPSFGRWPTRGVLDTAHRLDTLGGFARSVDDLALLDDILALPGSASMSINGDGGPVRIGIYRSESWDQAEPAMQAALERIAGRLRDIGCIVTDRETIAPFSELGEAQAVLHKHEASLCLGGIRREHDGKVSQTFKDFVDGGAAIDAATYAAACDVQDRCKAGVAALFRDVDLLLTPGAPGIAPAGLSATGNPLFNRSWTALGTPCLGFPADMSEGLPLGLQFVAPTGADRDLLALGGSLLDRIGIRLPEVD